MEQFWLVWNEAAERPVHKHMSSEGARNEAERLARMHRGETFHVLALVASCKTVDVQWTEVDPNWDVPL
jgi:hypothetical protein